MPPMKAMKAMKAMSDLSSGVPGLETKNKRIVIQPMIH